VANDRVRIEIGSITLSGVLTDRLAPRHCAVLRGLLPLERDVIQARWSGEAAWVPLGAVERLTPEQGTDAPKPGTILFYADALSEPELLIPYGRTRFACRDGPLLGSPVILLDRGLELLQALGKAVIDHGRQPLLLRLDDA
jgi:hypothetical protein